LCRKTGLPYIELCEFYLGLREFGRTQAIFVVDAPGGTQEYAKDHYQNDERDGGGDDAFPVRSVAVFHNTQYTRFIMLFHEKTKKAVSTGFVVIAILVIISMILLYFPALRPQ